MLTSSLIDFCKAVFVWDAARSLTPFAIGLLWTMQRRWARSLGTGGRFGNLFCPFLQVIVKAAGQSSALGRSFHVYNPRSPSYAALATLLRVPPVPVQIFWQKAFISCSIVLMCMCVRFIYRHVAACAEVMNTNMKPCCI